jgi:SmpA/OmlA family protein
MKIRTVVILVVIGGVAYWIYKDRPTVSGFVDGLTRPIMGSNAAVKESEHKRVVSDVVPAAPEGEPVSVQTIKKGMKSEEVREILGRPDRVEPFEEDGVSRIRWTYLATRRVVVFEGGRVVSIAIQ